MKQNIDSSSFSLLPDAAGYDPIEDRLRATVRATIEALFEEELAECLGRLRYGRGDDKAKGLSYDFPRLPCDKGAAARHPKYSGQRRGTDREWVGRCGPCGSVIAPVFSHDLNG